MLDVICNAKKVRTHTSHLDLKLFLYDQRMVSRPDQSFLRKCNQNDSMLTKSPNLPITYQSKDTIRNISVLYRKELI